MSRIATKLIWFISVNKQTNTAEDFNNPRRCCRGPREAVRLLGVIVGVPNKP